VDSTGGLTYGLPLFGSSTTGDWLQITLSSTTIPNYSAVSVIDSSISLSADVLGKINSPGGPFSLLKGTRNADGARLYVMQASPLVVVVGSSSVGGSAASGLLQIALP